MMCECVRVCACVCAWFIPKTQPSSSSSYGYQNEISAINCAIITTDSNQTSDMRHRTHTLSSV